jgi:RecB family endonuclease NucS
LIRQYLCENKNLSEFLSGIGIRIPAEEFEILGEKAFPEGHVDILIKEAVPRGVTRKIIIEVKRDAAKDQDLSQLKNYAEEIGDECIGAVLIAKRFSRTLIKAAQDKQIKLATYSLSELDESSASNTFENLLQNLSLEITERSM